MDAMQLGERLARGGRVQHLTGGEMAIGANHLYRLWTDTGTKILKIYGTAARERRERHALQALKGLEGLPKILDRGTEGEQHWVLMEDPGRWNLGTLPENAGLARKAGQILRAVHDTPASPMSNLSRGIDQEWVTVDFISTFRRLERYRGRMHMTADQLQAARSVRPPFASEPRAAHTDASPDNFVVDDDGNVTLMNWGWATLAPPEWDLSKAVWLTSLRAGPTAAAAFMEGYGRELEPPQLDRWTVYHAGMMLVYEAENRVRGGGEDEFEYLTAELQRAVTGARTDGG